MEHLPKTICNLLLNLPQDLREWLVQHVAPETFARWVKQVGHGKQICGEGLDRKRFLIKLKALKDGTELFSDLAIYEGCKQNLGD